MSSFTKNLMKRGREAVSEKSRPKKRYQKLQPYSQSSRRLQEGRPQTQSLTMIEQQSNIETFHVSQYDQANE